jgi:hypothetical protein
MVLSIAVLLTVGTLVFTLLVRAQDVPAPEPVSPTQHLDERKAQIYDNLRDLQFEFRLGKLSDTDYQKTKLGLQAELAKVLAEMDEIRGRQPQLPKTAQKSRFTPGTAAFAEWQLQAAKAAAPKLVLQPAPSMEAAGTTTCPHCGATFERALKFCGECGKAMS